MTKRQTLRIDSLLPGAEPKYIRIYDNGGETTDRYIAVFTGRYRQKTGGCFRSLSMSGAPASPQGVCLHGEHRNQIDVAPGSWAGPSIGRKCHLGVRIPFSSLPLVCQKVLLHDYCYLWDLPDPNTGEIPTY